MCLYLFGASRNSTKKGLECVNKVVNEFLVHTEEVEMERERVNEKIRCKFNGNFNYDF
jgi:hypothetical protein